MAITTLLCLQLGGSEEDSISLVLWEDLRTEVLELKTLAAETFALASKTLSSCRLLKSYLWSCHLRDVACNQAPIKIGHITEPAAFCPFLNGGKRVKYPGTHSPLLEEPSLQSGTTSWVCNLCSCTRLHAF